MNDGRARLFVALELPREVREALAHWRSRLPTASSRKLRPLAADSLHVTLCFLGWRGEDEIDAIAAACTVLAAEPAFALALGSVIWLPDRRPRVLAVELEDPEGRLTRAQATLSGALTAGGWYEPEPRPYLAHVTVARVGTGGGGGARELPEPPHLRFLGAHVVLYRSRLSRSGARYEALAEIELTGPG